MEKIRQIISESVAVKQALLEDSAALQKMNEVVDLLVENFRNGGKLLLCGNGGSAADAQHIAAELSGRFYKDREPLFAEALHVNSSFMTAVANDYSYDEVYARMVRAMGRKNDVLIGISTSGNSGNIIRAIKDGKKVGMITIGLTGKGGGKMADLCDHLIAVPSTDTPRIQESHILIGHILCELIEANLFD